MPIRSTPMETALLNKLDRLPVTPRRKLRLRWFDFSNYPVLCWYHGVTRQGRHYTMQCDVRADGSLEVSCRPILNGGKAFRMPKAKRFPGQLGY
ncbi:MAG: hypothetical protein PHR30_04520 [Gallionellaceae bacterium]|nr:hypothetical protein [Gallionellaceae bacterium]